MKVKVDRDLCQGHGVCVSEAPEVFALGERAATVTLLEEHPRESLRRKVEQAVKYCPTRALAIEDD